LQRQPRNFGDLTLVARWKEHLQLAIFLDAELPPKKKCFSTQEFARFEIIPLSISGCDQQNLENFLSEFKWSGKRLAHVFADD